MVRSVAQRDGISEEEATQHVRDVELLADAARAERDAMADPPPLVSEAREAFLRRGALARAWMDEVFEPEHGVEAIDDDDPILQKALASPVHARPELYRLCQLVAVPSGFDEDTEGLLAAAAAPKWKAAARARVQPVAQRLRRYVRPDDAHACRLMSKLMRYEDRDDGEVSLRVETKAFHLDACAQRSEDGSCAQPRWATEWIEQVRPRTEPGFGPLFESRFGLHLVFVVEVLPPAPRDDPATIAATREAILDSWRAAAFDDELEALRQRRAVRVAQGTP